jgi:hypothetical protein
MLKPATPEPSGESQAYARHVLPLEGVIFVILAPTVAMTLRPKNINPRQIPSPPSAMIQACGSISERTLPCT